MIDWKEGAVWFSMGKQRKFINNVCYYLSENCGWLPSQATMEECIKHCDFQLNEPCEGDYIEASELDIEQKYNDAVAVFRLFGVTGGVKVGGYALIHDTPSWGAKPTFVVHDVLSELCLGFITSSFEHFCTGKKLTYPQLMAIGKLKRAMIERDEAERGKLKHSVRFNDCYDFHNVDGTLKNNARPPSDDIKATAPLDVSGFNTIEQSREKRAKRNKSKQAYDILKSLDYEYDLVKQQWYKKAYI